MQLLHARAAVYRQLGLSALRDADVVVEMITDCEETWGSCERQARWASARDDHIEHKVSVVIRN